MSDTNKANSQGWVVKVYVALMVGLVLFGYRFRELIVGPKEDAELYLDRGTIYLAKGELDKGIADISEAIRLKPDYPEAYCSRGAIYLAKGEPDKSIADLSEGIRLGLPRPKLADAYWMRGAGRVIKGEYDKAIGDYTEAIRLNPKAAQAYYGRGGAYWAKGEQAKAKDDLAKAKELGYDEEMKKFHQTLPDFRMIR